MIPIERLVATCKHVICRCSSFVLRSLMSDFWNVPYESQSAGLNRRAAREMSVLDATHSYIRRRLIDEGHQPFGAPHVIGVLPAQCARQSILFHIHAVNEGR